MNRLVLSVLTLGVMLALVGPATAGDDDDALYRKILEEKSTSIVMVKFLLKVHAQQGVRERNVELEREVAGILVNADGLVLISNTDLAAKSRDPRDTITASPMNFRVLFPGDEDETEHEAVLAATDSNLHLAFIAMKDTKGLELNVVDFEKSVKPQVAQELIGVGRLPRGFDFAPRFGTVRVVAKIAKPRRMYVTEGTFSVPAGVLFDRAGMPVGVLALQQGAGGRDQGLFLLPGDIVNATIQQAAESAKQVLAEDKGGEEKPEDGDKKPDESGEHEDGTEDRDRDK